MMSSVGLQRKAQIKRPELIQWMRSSMAPLSSVSGGPPWNDLAPLGRMIGDARIVALSEGLHCAAEPLEFRNRVLRYLVEEKGFTAIAIESGLVEGRIVHEYVRGGPGDLSTVLRQGITWGMDQLPQNLSLIRSLRDYNADPKITRKVNFYGFDVPGSPAGPYANRGSDTALKEILDFLRRVDETAALGLSARAKPLIEGMLFSLQGSFESAGYEELPQHERDALTAIIVDIICLMERKESQYSSALGREEYKWAYRTALGAQQIDNWLRQIPVGWKPTSVRSAFQESLPFFSVASDVRDRAQADNLDWIVREEGPAGKVLVFASRYHLSASRLRSQPIPGSEAYDQEVAGTYLRRRFGDRLVTIGNLVGRGTIAYADYEENLQRPPPESVESLAGEVGVPLYLLDLRSAPPPVKEWLSQERGLFVVGQTLTLPLSEGFDLLFYVDSVTPAGWLAASAA